MTTTPEALALRCEQLATWHKPGGDTPPHIQPNVWQTATAAAAEIRRLDAEVERLKIALEAAGEEENALHAQLEEARHAPWPEWSTDILKMVRAESGYDGFDDDEGVDVAEEVRELIAEFKSQLDRLRSSEPIGVEVVGVVRQGDEDGPAVEWLLEGGLHAVAEGGGDTYLLVAHQPITDDCGHGEVYRVATA